MNELWTNSNSRKDFVVNGILDAALEVDSIFIAVAFFTNIGVIEKLAEKSHIRSIVI